MGKYSIDAFEQHPLCKIRPRVAPMTDSAYRLMNLSWRAMEPEDGELLTPPDVGEGRMILRLDLDKSSDAADACGFIRRMGRCYQGGKGLAGVMVSAGSCSAAELLQIAQAYAQGFENTFLLTEPGTALMDACCAQHIKTGLWLIGIEAPERM